MAKTRRELEDEIRRLKETISRIETHDVHPSIVVDEPGRPVAAPCAISGCQYKDLDESRERWKRRAQAFRKGRIDDIANHMRKLLADAQRISTAEMSARRWKKRAEIFRGAMKHNRLLLDSMTAERDLLRSAQNVMCAEIPQLYDVAREVCHEMGMSWTDPRTGKTYQPGEKP